MRKKLDTLGLVLITTILAFSIGLQAAQPFTGTTNTLGTNFIETDEIKFYEELWWDTENRTDTVAYPEQAASYIIFNSSTDVYAKNAETGQIDYGGSWDAGGVDGANASAVIQASIDAISQGKIFVKSGSYSTSVSIKPKSYITLEFEDNSVLYPTSDIPIINITGASWGSPIIECRIKGLVVWTSETNNNSWVGTGIYAKNIKWLSLEDIRIQRVNKGLEIGIPDSLSFDYVSLKNVQITETNNFGAQFGYGTLVQSREFKSDWCYDGTALIFNHTFFVQFLGTYLGNSQLMLKIDNVDKSPRIIEFNVLNIEGVAAPNTRAIEITSTAGYVLDSVILSGISTTGMNTTGITEEIYVSGAVWNLEISRAFLRGSYGGNNGGINLADSNVKNAVIDRVRWYGGTSYERILDSGTRTIYRGQNFENWGTSEASNDDWIAHGLVGEPDLVQLTIEETDANYFLQLKATNSTHFQIYLYDHDAAGVENTDKTINWYAYYEP